MTRRLNQSYHVQLNKEDNYYYNYEDDYYNSPLTQSVIDYKNSEEFEFKIILLGDANVGKTSILNKFMYNKFQTSYNATIGVEYKSKDIFIDNSCYAKLKIWDTCGQEKFRAITRQYFKNTNGVLLVFDLTNKASLEKVSSWLNDIKENVDKDGAIFLVGNKLDIPDRDNSISEGGKTFAAKNSLPYHEVSAKTGSGIMNLFDKISKKMISNAKNERILKDKKNIVENRIIDVNTLMSKDRGKIEVSKRKCC